MIVDGVAAVVGHVVVVMSHVALDPCAAPT